MIPSTIKELKSKLATMERHYDNAVNVVYQAAQKANEIQRTVSGVEGSSLFEDLAAIEAYVRKLTTELDSERERSQQLVTENARLRALMNAQDEYAYEDNGYVRLDTREDFHKVIGDGD